MTAMVVTMTIVILSTMAIFIIAVAIIIPRFILTFFNFFFLLWLLVILHIMECPQSIYQFLSP